MKFFHTWLTTKLKIHFDQIYVNGVDDSHWDIVYMASAHLQFEMFSTHISQTTTEFCSVIERFEWLDLLLSLTRTGLVLWLVIITIFLWWHSSPRDMLSSGNSHCYYTYLAINNLQNVGHGLLFWHLFFGDGFRSKNKHTY